MQWIWIWLNSPRKTMPLVWPYRPPVHMVVIYCVSVLFGPRTPRLILLNHIMRRKLPRDCIVWLDATNKIAVSMKTVLNIIKVFVKHRLYPFVMLWNEKPTMTTLGQLHDLAWHIIKKKKYNFPKILICWVCRKVQMCLSVFIYKYYIWRIQKTEICSYCHWYLQKSNLSGPCIFLQDNAKRGNIEVLLTIHVNTFVHEYCLHPFQHIIIKKWSCFAEAETIGQFNLHFHIFKGEYSTF